MRSILALFVIAGGATACGDDGESTPPCGNNRLDKNETCDDGNTTPGDGCNASCIVEFCGDSVTNNTTETCDDGNEVDGDGCDSTCLETGCASGAYTPGELCYSAVTAIQLGTSPQGVGLADFNGDGHLDAAVSSNSTTVHILFGDGQGLLTRQADLTAATSSTSNVLARDLDKDGAPDLLVSGSDSSNPGKVSVFMNDGTGTFGAAVGYDTQVFTRAAVVADFNGDSHLDFATIAQNSATIHRFFGDGSGAFTPAANITFNQPIAIVTGDLNEDGSPDLVIRQSGASELSLFLNLANGSGDFASPTPVPLSGVAGDFKLHDFDKDGHLDLAVNKQGTPDSIEILEGDGTGAFAPVGSFPVGTNSTGLRVGDLDGDGNVDLVQLSYDETSYYILSGEGGFVFAEAEVFPATFPADFDMGDLNGDGLLDLVLASQGGQLSVSIFEP